VRWRFQLATDYWLLATHEERSDTMICEVLQLGNPLLREVAEPVDDPGSLVAAAILTDLRETLAHWRATTTYGRGIAAPQIGVLRRIVFMNVDGNTPWPLINPSITARSPETMVVWDACLSFLCIFFQVTRHTWVTVRYQNPAGEWQELRAEGDLSELLQHEIDHLDGILAVDRMTDVRTICTREEFERRHRYDSPYRPAS
jgi:peptide deformylase